MTWASVVYIALTVVASVLAFVFKKYWDDKAASAAAEKQQIADEASRQAASAASTAHEREVNEGIDAQKKSGGDWANQTEGAPK